MKTLDETRHWYQEPYVWMVIAFPLSAVLAGIVTTYLAIISYDGLVVDDYYKRGLEINRRLDREQFAAANNIFLEVMLVEGQLRINIAHPIEFEIPDGLSVILSHTTRPGLDQTLPLTRRTETLYTAASVQLPAGRWHIEVGTAKWRATTSLSVTLDGG